MNGFRTTLTFDGRHVGLEEASVVADVGYHPGPKYGISFGAGAVLGGQVNPDQRRDVAAGFVATVSGTWLALYESETRPFLLASATISVSTTSAVSDDAGRHRLTAGDGRVGLMVGKTFGKLVPYAVARVFGGPVYWNLGGSSVTGSDIHHFTVGAGLSVRLPSQLDAFTELMPLGEQSLSLGLSLSF